MLFAHLIGLEYTVLVSGLFKSATTHSGDAGCDLSLMVECYASKDFQKVNEK